MGRARMHYYAHGSYSLSEAVRTLMLLLRFGFLVVWNFPLAHVFSPP